MKDDLFDLVKAELIRSNADKRHPYRNIQLATFGEYPEIRTVVKRKTTDALNHIIYTDGRTPKCRQLRKNDKATALFYHAKKKLQLRVRCRVEFLEHDTSEYQEYLAQVKQSSAIRDYTTINPPGTKMESGKDVRYGDQNHLEVLYLMADEIDVLRLDRAGHQRALYHRDGDGWAGQKLVP